MKIVFVSFLVLLSFSAYADVTLEATFNTPGFRQTKTTTVPDKLVELIDQIETGATLKIAVYEFEDMSVALAVLRASSRGVDVQVVFDGRKNKSDAKKAGTAVHALTVGANGLPPIKCHAAKCITYCGGFLGGACRGSRNNHNKFYSISQLRDGTRDVVAVTSANLNDGQLYWYNDLLVTKGDSKLRTGADHYFAGLVDTKLPVPLYIEGDALGLYTFPNKTSDPVLDELNKVSCQLPGSKIRVIQSRFTDDRSAVAKRLAELSRQGCDVQVLARHEPSMSSPGKKVAATLGPLLKLLPYEGKGPNETSRNTTHAKVVLIEASLNGSTQKIDLLLTGSHNLNGNSLKGNDELLMRIEGNKQLADQYFEFYDRHVADAEAAGFKL